MSEGQDGERTEAPSPKKMRDARQKGQVAKSQEVVMASTMFATIAYIWAIWDSLVASSIRLFDMSARLEDGNFAVNAKRGIALVARDVLVTLLPIFGLVIFVSIAANYLQIGSIFSFESIAPKLNKVSPAAGAKRIFSKKQLVEVIKSILKILVLSLLLFLVLKAAIGPLIYSLPCGLSCEASVTASLLKRILLFSALAFFIVAAADFMFQKHSYTKSLMMSKHEVKREYKESEGDPHIKSKRKELAQELIMNDDGGVARKSTAVVINPTHFAIAILFKEGVTPLPVVVAKGRNKHAHFIRTQAEEAGVPVFRNVPLAQALYAQTEVLDFVPDELFAAIAEVLAWVARNKSILYNGRIGSGVIDMDEGDHRKRYEDQGKRAN
jgi:type III secretion protein U